MEKAALQKEKELDQCKVCIHSIYDSVYAYKVDILNTLHFNELRLFKYLLCRVNVYMLSWDVGTVRILLQSVCVYIMVQMHIYICKQALTQFSV